MRKRFYNPYFTPMQYSPALWLDASDPSTLFQDSGGASATTPVLANADPVGTWKDKSGNGLHFTQTTASRRPTWATNTKNNLSGVILDGVDDYLSVPSFTALFNFLHSGQAVVFAVVKVSTVLNPGNNKAVLSNFNFSYTETGYTLAYFDNPVTPSDDSPGVLVGNGSAVDHVVFQIPPSGTWIPSNWAVVCNMLDITNSNPLKRSFFYLDNLLVISNYNTSSDTYTSSDATRNMRLGSGGAGGSLLDGGILEVIVYSNMLDASKVLKIHKYLSSKWAIAIY